MGTSSDVIRFEPKAASTRRTRSRAVDTEREDSRRESWEPRIDAVAELSRARASMPVESASYADADPFGRGVQRTAESVRVSRSSVPAARSSRPARSSVPKADSSAPGTGRAARATRGVRVVSHRDQGSSNTDEISWREERKLTEAERSARYERIEREERSRRNAEANAHRTHGNHPTKRGDGAAHGIKGVITSIKEHIPGVGSKTSREDDASEKKEPERITKTVELFGRSFTFSLPVIPFLANIHAPELGPEAKRRLRIAAVLFIVVFGLLYGPARDLYTARREEQVLTARLERINAENEELTEALQTLQTREGIEDEARRRGFVNAGETPVRVEGLEETEGSQPGGSGIITQETEETEEDPFYIRFFDFFFQYRPSV
ncbi:MAG: septum formation initiator family protein [Atopobiaceae bacterium]|nr:septum formation initiator family protein [Atopobiaceae bacterium]